VSTCACVRGTDVRVRIRTCAGWPPTAGRVCERRGWLVRGGWRSSAGHESFIEPLRVWGRSRGGWTWRYLFFLPAISGSKENNISNTGLTCYCHHRNRNRTVLVVAITCSGLLFHRYTCKLIKRDYSLFFCFVCLYYDINIIVCIFVKSILTFSHYFSPKYVSTPLYSNVRKHYLMVTQINLRICFTRDVHNNIIYYKEWHQKMY